MGDTAAAKARTGYASDRRQKRFSASIIQI